MTTDKTEAEHIAGGIEAAFRNQSHYAYERRAEAFEWLGWWREKLGAFGATNEQADAIDAEARAIIEARYAERLDAIQAKRPATYAGYGLDADRFGDSGLMHCQDEEVILADFD